MTCARRLACALALALAGCLLPGGASAAPDPRIPSSTMRELEKAVRELAALAPPAAYGLIPREPLRRTTTYSVSATGIPGRASLAWSFRTGR